MNCEIPCENNAPFIPDQNQSGCTSFLLHAEVSCHCLSAFYTEVFEHLLGNCHHLSDMVRITVNEIQILWWMRSVIMFGSDVRKSGLVWCVYLADLLFIQCFLGRKKESQLTFLRSFSPANLKACCYILFFAMITLGWCF